MNIFPLYDIGLAWYRFSWRPPTWCISMKLHIKSKCYIYIIYRAIAWCDIYIICVVVCKAMAAKGPVAMQQWTVTSQTCRLLKNLIPYMRCGGEKTSRSYHFDSRFMDWITKRNTGIIFLLAKFMARSIYLGDVLMLPIHCIVYAAVCAEFTANSGIGAISIDSMWATL